MSNRTFYEINYADSSSVSVEDLLNGYVNAVRDIPVYLSPAGQYLKTFKKGSTPGRLKSYVMRDGFVWWELGDNNLKSQSMWFKHTTPGVFDKDVALKTGNQGSDTEWKKRLEESGLTESQAIKSIGDGISSTVSGVGAVVQGAGKSLSALGNFLPLIVISVLIIAIIIFSKKL